MFYITDTHKDMVSYVDSLQKKYAESLSFYPKCVFERESEAKRILLGILNDEPCGYIYHGAIKPATSCHQVCIQYDARNKLHGASLVSKVEEKASLGGAYVLRLRCGFDLDANEFWKSIGYGCVDIVKGGIRRNRKINVWEKEIQPSLFSPNYIEPSKGKTSSSVWRKGKTKGIITGFSRGKSLDAYRSIVEEKAKGEVEGAS